MTKQAEVQKAETEQAGQAEAQKAETEQAETGQAEAGRTESDSVNAQISFNRNIWLRRLVLVLLGLLMGLQIYFVNAGRIMGDLLPMPFGYGAAVVLSGSMEPTYSAGDLLIVKKADHYQTGDIVVYQTGQNLVVHRITDMNGETVTTQGDANNAPDEPFAVTQIKGISVGSIPFVGTWFRILKTPAGLMAAFLCTVFLTEVSFRKQSDAGAAELEKLKEEIQRLKQDDRNTKG